MNIQKQRLEGFCKKAVPKNFAIFTRNHLESKIPLLKNCKLLLLNISALVFYNAEALILSELVLLTTVVVLYMAFDGAIVIVTLSFLFSDIKIQIGCPEVFYGKDVLENSPKFAGKHLCESVIFNKAAGLKAGNFTKKETPTRVFL